MKKLEKFQKLILCFIGECLVLFIGMKFFDPFSIRELNTENVLLAATIGLYVLTCYYGIHVAKVTKILNEKHEIEIYYLCLLLSFTLPWWWVILCVVIVFTLVLLSLEVKEIIKKEKFLF